MYAPQVVCTEAMGAGVTPVAKEALLHLHERLCAAGSQEEAAPGDEATVLRCLIRLTAGMERLPPSLPARSFHPYQHATDKPVTLVHPA